MHIIITPDSFKGTFTAAEVAAAISRGVAASSVVADVCPVADGGEGTLEALMAHLGGRLIAVPVRDPLGRTISAEFALLGDGYRAIVEMAAASGLGLLAPHERDPWRATTHGTGELIRSAVQAGAREIMVAVGGSATVDGGQGALAAITEGGGVDGAHLIVLCDVETPWERCAEIFGPQKGADPPLVRSLASRLDSLAVELPRDPRGVPGTGAAGGLAGALWAALDAELTAGAPFVLDALGFDRRLAEADCVIVGEGRVDAQSAMGKIVGEICARARDAGVPVHAFVGVDGLEPQHAAAIGLRSVTEATTLAELEMAGRRLAHDLVDA